MPKLYAVQAIIFDLDGTLVDSAEDLRAAVNRSLGEVGLRPIEANEIKGMIGDGVLKLIERALVTANGDPVQKDALLRRFLELSRRGRNPQGAAAEGFSSGGCDQQAGLSDEQYP